MDFCKRLANERSVTHRCLLSLDSTQARFLALQEALSDTPRYLLANTLTPLHGGGQGFDSPAVHQVKQETGRRLLRIAGLTQSA